LQALKVQSTALQTLLKTLGLPKQPADVATLPITNPLRPFLDYYVNHWISDTATLLNVDLAQKNQPQFETHFYAAILDLTNHLPSSIQQQLDQQAADLVRSWETAASENQQLRQAIAAIANKPVLTLQYADTRPQNQNSYSTARLIFDKSFGKSSKWSVTANGAVAFNIVTSSAVPGSSTFRDAQAGVEGKYTFGALTILGKSLGNAALSATYYYQDQHSPSVLNVTPGTPLTGITITGLPSTATQVFAAAGNIHIGQLRLELGSGSSLKFPIAISYSNRSELITKPEFKAQIGLSYNFDSLLSSSQTGSQ
jgi:hypothetical protein